jgi:hypothetical protein
MRVRVSRREHGVQMKRIDTKRAAANKIQMNITRLPSVLSAFDAFTSE